MKKRIVVPIIVILLILMIFLCLTGFFTKGVISNRIYFPRNVYEEIWNMVIAEEWFQDTLLTSSTEDAYVDFDHGYMFVGVYIPQCNASLHTGWDKGEVEYMTINFWVEDKHYEYRYVYDAQTLYGDMEEAYLIENFLTDYFQWYEVTSHLSSKFSLDDLGGYTYQFADPIYSYELTE